MITVVSGRPGAGKGYYLTRVALAAIKRGRAVYSNYPIDGAYELTQEMVKTGTFPMGSLLVLEESQVWYNTLDWREMDPEQLRYFCQHRHDGVDVFFAVQNPGALNKQLREIAGEFLWLRSWGVPMRRIERMADPVTGEVRERVRWDKRALVMKGEGVESYDAWCLSHNSWREQSGYRAFWHLVRPSVFRRFDSWDKTLLAGRETVPSNRWPFGVVDLGPGGAVGPTVADREGRRGWRWPRARRRKGRGADYDLEFEG